MTIREFKQDKLLFYPFLASAALILIAALWAFFGLAKINNLLILHYDGYKGIDFLGNKGDIWRVLGLSAAIVGFNFLLAKKLYYKERFLSYAFSFSSSIFSLLILIGIFVIISIN